jgi:hypothetical protein
VKIASCREEEAGRRRFRKEEANHIHIPRGDKTAKLLNIACSAADLVAQKDGQPKNHSSEGKEYRSVLQRRKCLRRQNRGQSGYISEPPVSRDFSEYT